jgi:sialic acid synthase SpsE
MSANHGNNINIAIKIIKKAKECGANAIKIQTYKADTLTLIVINLILWQKVPGNGSICMIYIKMLLCHRNGQNNFKK